MHALFLICRCQEGMPLKVAEFLSSVGLSGSGAAGEAGTHQSHSVSDLTMHIGHAFFPYDALPHTLLQIRVCSSICL